ncbi:MAG: hypothetical protein H0Z35_13760 [Thermoanaerobacteraceae bacterium]|nr:hypothetical protein [Thermoanaerobacteraceae bacterium]
MFKKLLVLVLSLILMLSAGGILWAAEGAGGAKPWQVVKDTGSTDKEEAVGNEAEEEVEEEEAEVKNDGEKERGLSGLQNALERVKANGSPVAQKVLSKLIEADGDVQSIAQTLRDITDEEIDELDEETKEQLEAATEEVREKVEQDAEMNEESKKEPMLPSFIKR